MTRISVFIKKSLRNQLILVFVSLSVIMITTLIFFSYHVFSEALQKNYIDSSSQLLSQLESYVSSYFETGDKTTIQLYSDIMLSPEYYISTSDNYEAYNYIIKKLQNLFLQSIDMHSVSLYLLNTDELYIINQHSGYSRHVDRALWNTSLLHKIIESNSMLILPQQSTEIFPDEFDVTENENVFTIARSIKIDNRAVAVLFINYFPTSLCQAFSENIDVESSILLCDQGGNYIAGSSSVPLATDVSILKNVQAQSGVFQIGSGLESQLYLYQKTDKYPLILFKQIPMRVVLQQAQSLRSTLLLIALCFILAIILIIVRISFHMTNRIISLKQCMNTVASGNFDIHLSIKGEDEISDISKSFINMNQKIQSLIQEKYVAELESQRATLKALNAQINPHFLYNTLQTISSIAHEEGVPDIEIMMKSLSNMMRYAIKPAQNADEQIATAACELQNCEDYLKLLSYRYTDRLLYNITVDPNCNNILIPRLSLQPLVENAILHGIDAETSPCVLLIEARLENETCTITITDNGRGLSQEELSTIKKALSTNESSTHLGLRNVYTRFHLLYSDTFNLDISSTPHRRTCVKISIFKPKKMEEQ